MYLWCLVWVKLWELRKQSYLHSAHTCFGLSMHRLAFEAIHCNCFCTVLHLCGCWVWQYLLVCVQVHWRGKKRQKAKKGQRVLEGLWRDRTGKAYGNIFSVELCVNWLRPYSPHLKVQVQARSWGCGLDLIIDLDYRQSFWKYLVLRIQLEYSYS